jgi:GntR family transcriptional regulator
MYAGLLPPEAELVESLQTTRNVLRGALQWLVEEGVVRRVRGSGTYAVAHRRHVALDELRSYRENRPERTSYRVLEAGFDLASAPVALALDIEPGERVVLLERLVLLDGEPVALLTHWLPASLAAGLLDLDLSDGYYRLLEDGLGLRMERAQATIDAVRADAGTARLLGVATGAPLLFMHTVTRLDDGRPIDFVCSRTRPDRMVLRSTKRRTR